MDFRNDLAAQTLGRALDDLAGAWQTLRPDARRALEAWVQAQGPKIADRSIDGANVISRVTTCLGALWQLRDYLPPSTVTILQSGQGLSGMASLSPADRELLLRKMVAISDFRLYDDPRSLAAQADALVSRFRSRLAAAEQRDWQALHDAWAAGGDPTAYLRAVDKLLAGYPKVRNLLAPHKVWTPAPIFRDAEMLGPVAKGSVGAAPRDVGPSAPAASDVELTRYANVNFPDRVLLTEKRVALLIQVTREHQDWSAVSADQSRMTLKLGPLTVVVTAEGFDWAAAFGGREVKDARWAREVDVLADRDCDPVAFLLTPQSVGLKKIQIDFYQFKRNILTLSLQTTVTADAAELSDRADVEIRSTTMESPAGGAAAPIPDLDLRVIVSADHTKLFYLLHAPKTGDYNFKSVGQVDLQADPQTFLKQTFDKLSTLARVSADTRTDAQTRSALRDLETIGQNLYQNLFPPELKAEYIKIRKNGKYQVWQITSDDPWIPWEMVRPFDASPDEAAAFYDPPLCEKYQLSRWLSGAGAPDQIRMRNGVWVAPPDNLQAAQQESDYFTAAQNRQWDLTLEGPLGAVDEVDDRFRGGATEFYHFACHGNFNTDDPNESKLKLAGDFLRPSQIIGPAQAGLRRSKPLVFLNACYGGQIGFTLTQLGGWAERFLESGASAFVGSLWEINDKLAAQFTRAFYDRLWGLGDFDGKAQPLGQAFYEARMAIKALDQANPTWLAYVLYGDPCGMVKLGG